MLVGIGDDSTFTRFYLKSRKTTSRCSTLNEHERRGKPCERRQWMFLTHERNPDFSSRRVQQYRARRVPSVMTSALKQCSECTHLECEMMRPFPCEKCLARQKRQGNARVVGLYLHFGSTVGTCTQRVPPQMERWHSCIPHNHAHQQLHDDVQRRWWPLR